MRCRCLHPSFPEMNLYPASDRVNLEDITTVSPTSPSIDVQFFRFEAHFVNLIASILFSGKKENYTRDIPGPKALPVMGTRWLYSKWFGFYRLNKVHEAYAGNETSGVL